MIKMLLILAVALSLFAGIYNDDYIPEATTPYAKERHVTKEKNPFLYGNFEKIYRYDGLYVDGDSFDSDESQERFDAMLQVIKENQESRDVLVSILGNTKQVENKKQDIDTDNFYTNFFQSIGQYDRMDVNASKDRAKDEAKYVYDSFIDNNISEKLLYKENRMGGDNLYTEGTSDGRSLNNRVDVAIYIVAPKPLVGDEDHDGVIDPDDYCPMTPAGTNVDKHGCPRLITLHLNFKFDENTLDENSTKKVVKFSTFLAQYHAYNITIIGHTDNYGSDAYNMKLSKRRARIVKSILSREGIVASRMSTDGRGEREPVASNKSKKGRALNRRTEVELYIPQENEAKKESKEPALIKR